VPLHVRPKLEGAVPDSEQLIACAPAVITEPLTITSARAGKNGQRNADSRIADTALIGAVSSSYDDDSST
jgi:hypothetical protein